GKEVAFLAMVEPTRIAPGRVRGSFEMVGVILRRLASQGQRHSKAVLNLGREERRQYLRIRWRYYAIHWAVRRYRPKNYSGRTYLYLTEESLIEGAQGRLKWLTCAKPGVEVRKIAGTHQSITGKNGVAVEDAEMKNLAALLRVDLETSQQTSEGRVT